MRHWVSSLILGFSLVTTPAWADDASLGQARKALALSKYDVAAEALKKAPAGLERTYLQTRILLWTGRYDEAAKVAAKGMRGDEAKRMLGPWRAEALVRSGDLDAAIQVLRDLEGDDEAHRAHVYLGELLIRDGKRAEARDPLMKPIRAYNADAITSSDAEGLSLVARAAYLLRAHADANDAFNEAERAGANRRVETLLWRGEQFLDKYDPGHAGQVIGEAEKLAPNDPRVRVLKAEVLLAGAMDFGAAEAEVKKALAVDPRLAEAFYVRAGLALRMLDLEGADAALDEGLKTNPENLELLSMKAATRFLADDRSGFERLEKKVLGLNPEYSRLYTIVAEFAEWEHRYAEIVKMMRKAVKVDRADAKAYAALGLNLIRDGRDDEGMGELKKAWRRDKYNVRVYNTLNLFEETIPKDYVTVGGTTFKIRYHKGERRILERYVPQMLERAWSSMTERYGFTPTTPVGIELYADSQSFSIRTSGLPNVGIQGVCFGKTLAALSPGAGSFNWGMILWHELAHVFHIQMSKSHVPRWFTEGLAEYETIIQRDEWQREEHLALYHGLREGKIPQVASFNEAFTHVDDPRDVTMAYFAASQISVFLADEFGFDKIAAHLPLWAAGKRTPEVVQQALGISADELDRRYRAWLQKRLSRYDEQFVPDLRPPKDLDEARQAVKDDPDDASKLVKLAVGLLQSGNMPEGLSTLKLALLKDPKERNGRYLKLQLAMQERKLKEAKALVEGLLKDADGYAVQMKAADIAEADKDEAAMRKHFHAAYRFDPSQAEPVQALYDLSKKANDGQTELWALRELAKLEQHDRRVFTLLLTKLVELGQWKEAARVGEAAIYVDVMNPEIHVLYARALARTGKQVSAIYELNSALLAGPEPARAAKIYRAMAEGYDKLGKPDFATKARRYAGQVAALAK